MIWIYLHVDYTDSFFYMDTNTSESLWFVTLQYFQNGQLHSTLSHYFDV